MDEIPETTARRYLRKLSRGADIPSGLEASTRESAMRDSLTADRAGVARDRAVLMLPDQPDQNVRGALLEELDELYLEHGVAALERLKISGGQAELSENHVGALEAIVETDGSRPTLELSEDDQIDTNDPALGQWRPSAKEYAEAISKVSAAVGRIDLDGQHRGTGFVIRDDLILTNRHVLQELTQEATSGEWRFLGEPTITFDADPSERRTRQFPLKKRVVCAGERPIDPHRLDFSKLDFAVLQAEVGGENDFPEPLPLEADADKVVVDRPVYTVGYPAKPPPWIYRFRILWELFRHRFGVKRFSPGEVGGVASGANTVFSHDATTLGGNSGSCVVDFGEDGMLVVGLHFAGQVGVANHAHSSARLRAESSELRGLGLSWKDWI